MSLRAFWSPCDKREAPCIMSEAYEITPIILKILTNVTIRATTPFAEAIKKCLTTANLLNMVTCLKHPMPFLLQMVQFATLISEKKKGKKLLRQPHFLCYADLRLVALKTCEVGLF